MTKTTISPFVVAGFDEVELTDDKGAKKKLWRKQILPSGTRKYGADTLDFSVINPSCVKAFEDGAFPQVPFVLAMSDNSHPKPGLDEIKNTEGDVQKLELSSDGSLYGYFDLSNSDTVKSAIAKSNGKFGVSGRIEVDYEAKDSGKKYPYALSHVCGTTRPYVKGLKPWEAVELSEDEKAQETLDLSTEVLEIPIEKESEEVEVPGIPKETLDFLVKFAADQKAAEDRIAALDKPAEVKPEVTLSEADNKRIELAEAQTRSALELAEKATKQLAESNWRGRRAELARAGVPPVVLTAAEKVLKHAKRPTIDLSDGESVDAASVIEEMLEACKGVVNLSDESGHSHSDGGVNTELAALEKSVLEDLGYVTQEAK